MIVGNRIGKIFEYCGIFLRPEELLDEGDMLSVVEVGTEEIDVSVTEHPIGHFLLYIAIVAFERKDVALELDTHLLKTVIVATVHSGIIEIALRMCKNEAVAIGLKLLNGLFKIRDRLAPSILDEEISATKRTNLTLRLAPLARRSQLAERIVGTVFEAEILAFDLNIVC